MPFPVISAVLLGPCGLFHTWPQGHSLPFYHIHKGRTGACAHGEVNVMLFALFVININRVSSEFSLF